MHDSGKVIVLYAVFFKIYLQLFDPLQTMYINFPLQYMSFDKHVSSKVMFKHDFVIKACVECDWFVDGKFKAARTHFSHIIA